MLQNITGSIWRRQLWQFLPGMERMLELAGKDDARFFYVSSGLVYGDSEVFPTPESYEG